MFPDYFTMIDAAKDTIYQTYQQLYRNISIPNLVLIYAQSALFVLVVVIVTYKFITFSRKMKEVFKLIVKVDQSEFREIVKHWNSLLDSFSLS